MIQLIGSKLYQWELGRQVRLTNQSTSIIPELHYLDYKSPNCLVVEHKIVNGEIVYDVPNILLQQTMDIFVYIVLKDGDKKEVIGTKTFVVTPKQRGSDYVYTPTEIKSYESLEERIKSLEEKENEGGIAEETDPTVSEWAKQPTKPSYTADEVGAIQAPNTARVGQIIAVKAVDDNGKPTEFEAVDRNVVNASVLLKDTETEKIYKLEVINGKLTMTEVA